MINRSILVGRLTKDPELRRTQNGTPVASFTIALNRNFTNQNGEREADFIPCIVWNKAAENLWKYCGKGSLVGVDGHLQSRQYENQDSRKITVIEVICDSIQYLETRSQTENRQQGRMTSTPSATTNEYNEDLESISKANQQDSTDIADNMYGIMDNDIQF